MASKKTKEFKEWQEKNRDKNAGKITFNVQSKNQTVIKEKEKAEKAAASKKKTVAEQMQATAKQIRQTNENLKKTETAKKTANTAIRNAMANKDITPKLKKATRSSTQRAADIQNQAALRSQYGQSKNLWEKYAQLNQAYGPGNNAQGAATWAKGLEHGAETGVNNLKSGYKQGLLSFAQDAAPYLAGERMELAAITPNKTAKNALLQQADAMMSNELQQNMERQRRANAVQAQQKQQAINQKYGELEGASKVVSDVVSNAIPMAPAIVTGALSGGTLSSPMFFAYGRGMGEQSALNGGATMEQANIYGLASGALEAGTEALVGGLPGTNGLLNANLIKSFMKSDLAKKLTEASVDIAGEGLEEVLAGIADPYIQRATWNPDAENATLGELAYQGALGSLTSGAFKGVNVASNALANTMAGTTQDFQTQGQQGQVQNKWNDYVRQQQEFQRQQEAEAEKLSQELAKAEREAEQAKIAARNAIIEQNKQLNRYIPSQNAQNGIQQPINNHTINPITNQNNEPQNETSKADFPQTEQNPKDIRPILKRPTPEPTIPMEQRNFDNVKDKNVLAYQQEHPEVKPYQQAVANQLLADLDMGVKGGMDVGIDPETRNVTQRGGWKRQQSEPVNRMLEAGLSYQKIRKGLEDIVEDNGKENNTTAKRVELYVNDAVVNGYDSITEGRVEQNNAYHYRGMSREQLLAERSRLESNFTGNMDTDNAIIRELETIHGLLQQMSGQKAQPVNNDITPELQTAKQAQQQNQQSEPAISENETASDSYEDYDVSQLPKDVFDFYNQVGEVGGKAHFNIRFVQNLEHDVEGKSDGHGNILISAERANDIETLRRVVAHECYHAMKNTDQWKDIQDLAYKLYKLENPNGTKEQMLQAKIDQYYQRSGGKVQLDKEGAWDEVGAELMGEILSDPKMADRIWNQNPTLAQRITRWLEDMVQKLHDFVFEVEAEDSIYKQAFEAYSEGLQSMRWHGGMQSESRYSIVHTTDGKPVVVIESDIFADTKPGEKKHKVIADYIKQHIGEVYTIIESGQNVYIGKDLPGEYTQSGYTKNLYKDKLNAKNQASQGLGEMIEIASNRSWKKNEKKKHEHDAKYGWYRYNTKFVLPDGQIYDAQLLVRNSEDGKKYLYDMINIKKDSRSALARSTRERLYREQSSPTDMTTFNDDSISQRKSNVNGQSGTRYSLAGNSEALKERQLDIIQNSNPMQDNYHTGIRSVNDILTFEEAMQEESYTPDYTEEMAQNALRKGTITVYSSYPIEQGVFVTPSKMEAQNYAGNGNVYSKTVGINDVAWVDTIEGQYANAKSDIRYSLNNPQQDNIDRYGAIPPGENPTGDNRDIQVPQRTADDNRVGSFNRTAAESKQVNDQTVDALMRDLRTYKPSSNQKQLNYANNVIGSVGWEEAAHSFQTRYKSGERMTANDVAIGERCIQEAQKAGDYQKAAELIGDVASLGVELGQAVQAMRLLKRLTPEGRLMALKRVQQRINADLQQKNKKKKSNDITPKLKRAGDGSGNIYAADTIGQKQPNMQQQSVDDSQAPFSSASQNNVASTDDIQNGNIYQTSGQSQQDVTQQDLGFKPVTISPETEQRILEAIGPKAMDEAWDAAVQEMADQVDATLLDKVRAWRYLSMLSNLRTHIRNLVSNGVKRGVIGIEHQIQAGLEAAFVKDGGERYRTFKKVPKEYKEFAEWDFETNIRRQMEQTGSRYNDAAGQINRNKRIFKPNILETGRKSNENALAGVDMVFKKEAYINAFANYMLANNLSPSVLQSNANATSTYEAAQVYAKQKAYEATFQEANTLANFLSQIEHSSKVGEVIIGALMPFKKTPLNILKQGTMVYSPIGLVHGIGNAMTKVRTGEMTQVEAIEQISRGLTGTGIAAVGALMMSLGMIALGGDDDKRKAAYDRQMGDQNYALKFSDGSTYSIDWLSPSVMPLLMGAEIYDTVKRASNGELTDQSIMSAVTSSLMRIGDPLLEMSCMSGFADALSSYSEGGTEALSNIIGTSIKNYAGQFIPAPLGALARTIDDTVRSSYASKDSSIGKGAEQFLRQQRSKIPMVSMQNEASIDVWGNERKREGAGDGIGNVAFRAFNNFVNPGNYSSNKRTSLDNELERLYQSTGDSGIFPAVASGTINESQQNPKISMTPLEFSKFSTTKGKKSQQYVSDFVNSEAYDQLDDSEKADIISSLYSLATYEARKQILTDPLRGYDYSQEEYENVLGSGVKPYEYYSTKKRFDGKWSNYEVVAKYAEHADRMGMDDAKYVEMNEALNDIRADKKNGKSVSGSREKKVRAYLDDELNAGNITAEQWWYWYAMEYSSKAKNSPYEWQWTLHDSTDNTNTQQIDKDKANQGIQYATMLTKPNR